MTDGGSMKERLDSLESRISAARERLRLNDALHKDHAATIEELTRHYQHLQQQLDVEAADLASQGVHVDSFEKTVLNWINGLTFNR
jgi:DNA repair ATPase RecN